MLLPMPNQPSTAFNAFAMLTPDQQEFVQEWITGAYASLADYCRKTGHRISTVRNYRNNPAVVSALRQQAVKLLITEDIPLARNVLREIASDKGAPAHARVAAAKTLLDRAGVLPPVHQNKQEAKNVSDLSSDELRDMIARIEAELGGRAKDVSPEWDS